MSSFVTNGRVRLTARANRLRGAGRREWWGLVFVSPAIFYLLIIVAGPLLFGFWISLHSWNPLADLSTARWVGLKNFEYELNIDPRFIPSLRNSAVYAVARLVGNLVLGLSLALLMNSRRIRGLNAWRVLLYLPMATSAVVLAYVWLAFFAKSTGLLNVLLDPFGFPARGWLKNPDTAMAAVILMGTHRATGYFSLIFLAGLQGIPQELKEAALVDGANAIRVLWHVTLPLLRPVIAFVVVISTITGLQVFDLVYASTRGGPADRTLTTVVHMYRTVFTFGHAGRGTAMAYILFAVVLVFAVFQLRLFREQT